MCCSSKRLLPHENLTWFNQDRGELTRSEVDDTCLTLTNVSRNDYTTFTCLANGGTASKQTTINVMCKYCFFQNEIMCKNVTDWCNSLSITVLELKCFPSLEQLLSF